MNFRILAASLTVAILTGCGAAAPVPITNFSAVTSSQKISYPSANGIKIYADIFSGKSFERQTLTSQLYLPDSCEEGGQVPAVVIQHGSGAPKHTWYPQLAKNLNRSGIAALIANSYSARAIRSTAKDQTQLTVANRTYDTFSAFRALQSIPCIDPDRIGITGYSYGGLISREVVESALAERLGNGHVFKASLPVYPYCLWEWENSRPTKTKVHYLLAELDDWNLVKDCLERIPYLQAAGWDVSYTIYPDAHHGFIADKFYGFDAQDQTFNECGIYWIDEDGHYSISTVGASTRDGIQKFMQVVFKTKCAKLGATSGRNENARAKTMDFTVKFFSDNL